MPLKEGFIKKEGKHVYRPVNNNSHYDQLNVKQQLAVQKLEELLIEERKAYHTRKGYRNIIISFFLHYKHILPSQISYEQIRAYILKRIKEDNISKSTQNHYVSTFKAFYGRLLNQYEKVENLYRPEPEMHLPKTLEPDEIVKLLKQVGNLKHRSMLMLMYGSGLRVGEMVRLRLQDIDFEHKTVFVDTGKHYKDRYTILSDKTAACLQLYLQQQQPKPNHWVFESPDGGHYSERSVQQLFADALAKACIRKQVSTHSLRHAFATQLIKSNVDLDFVRKVMGHASIKTTQVYLHVLKTDLTKTRSPMDDLDI
jgi:site-specific recombinase XerD